MEIINKITFDMAAAGMPPYIDAVQGDAFTRKVEVTLMTRGQVFDPSDGFVSVSVAFKKPDGTAGWYDTMPDGSSAATVISDGVYQVSLAPEMFSVPGSVYALFRFDLDGKTISTFPFIVRVAENPSFNSTKSENYYNVQTWDSVNASFDEIFDRLAKLEQGGGGIDDENISTKTTWSSQNIVEKLCPPFTEKGAAVACEPVDGSPLDVVTHVPGEAAGETVTLYHVGKNIFGGEALADAFAEFGATKYAESGTIRFPSNMGGKNSNKIFTQFKQNTQYTLIVYGNVTYSTNLAIWYEDGNYEMPSDLPTDGDGYSILTTKAGKSVVAFGTINAGGITILHYDKCGIFEGVITPEDFEPYWGETKTVTIPDAALEGTYNWGTGVLTESDGKTTQLSPNDITAYPGVNTFWSSYGETEVNGYADPKALFAKLSATLTALTGV